MSEQARKTVLIKRYASRRLYDTEAGVYVTLDDLARYVREGKEVRVLDKDTNEDLTSQYLIQIIADRDAKGDSALPLNVLADLVRMYHAQTSALTPSFLSEAVSMFQKQQEELAASPMAFLNTLETWQAKQAELFSTAMQAWNSAAPKSAAPMSAAPMSAAPKSAAPMSAGQPAGQTSGPESAEKPEPPAAPGKDSPPSDRIAALEAQLKTLQDELRKLK